MRTNLPLLILTVLTAAFCLAGALLLVGGIWGWESSDFSELSSIRQIGPAVAAALQSSVSRFATVALGIVVLLAGLIGTIVTLHAAAIASSVKNSDTQ